MTFFKGPMDLLTDFRRQSIRNEKSPCKAIKRYTCSISFNQGLAKSPVKFL